MAADIRFIGGHFLICNSWQDSEVIQNNIAPFLRSDVYLCDCEGVLVSLIGM